MVQSAILSSHPKAINIGKSKLCRNCQTWKPIDPFNIGFHWEWDKCCIFVTSSTATVMVLIVTGPREWSVPAVYRTEPTGMSWALMRFLWKLPAIKGLDMWFSRRLLIVAHQPGASPDPPQTGPLRAWNYTHQRGTGGGSFNMTRERRPQTASKGRTANLLNSHRLLLIVYS